MKVRSEFVTNSSSTSFGASFGDALIALLLGLGLSGMECGGDNSNSGSKNEGGGSSSSDAEMDSVLAAAAQAAQDAANQMAQGQDAADALVNNILGEEGAKLDAQNAKLEAEIDAYTKQWQESQATADKTDPNYETVNKQYQDYIDYLKGQKDLVAAQKYELQVAQAQKAAEDAAKTDWVKQQQEDLVQTLEQKSFLQAVANGYGKQEGYDIGKVQSQLDALNQREAAIRGTLQANKIDFDYTAKSRDDIGPSKDILDLKAKHEAKMQQLQNEINAEKEVRNNARRDALIKEREWQEKVFNQQMSKAAFFNGLTKGAETIQKAADVGVEALSHVTGPAGKYVKGIYKFSKGVAGGVGEGMANGNYGENIAKGIVKGASDVAKDVIKDKYGQKAQNIYIAVSEPGKAVINSVIEGKTSAGDITSAATTGAIKGISEVGVNVITDKLPTATLPKGFDASDTSVKDAGKNMLSDIKKVLAGEIPKTPNPFCQGLAKGTFKGGADAVKDYLKGTNPYSGGPPNYPKQILDGVGKTVKTGVNKVTS